MYAESEKVSSESVSVGVQVDSKGAFSNGNEIYCVVQGKLDRVYRRVVEAETIPFTFE
jgi:hypothetical protein